MVTVEHLGHSCFKVQGKQGSVIIDPFNPGAVGLPWNKRKANLVLVTVDSEDRNNLAGIDGSFYAVTGPGEYEVSQIKVRGIATADGATIYAFTVDDIHFLHLGGLKQLLEEKELAEISEVDVLMIPVGGVDVLDAELAAQVTAQVEPRVVIPMHYQENSEELAKFAPVEKFIEEMGEEMEERSDLKLKSPGDLPEETEVIVLR